MRVVDCTLIACISLFGASVRLSAQSPQPASPTYQRGIDVINYDVGIDLPDTGTFVHGDVTVLLARARDVRLLRLDLVDSLSVRSVDVDGRRVTASHTADKIEIPLDGAGDSVRVRVVYEGRVRDGLVIRKDTRGRWTWFGDNWPNRGHQWLPLVDHPSDKATVSFRITAAPSLTVVANGELVSTRRVTVKGRMRKETRWRETRAIAPYLMVIAVAPLARFDVREPSCHYGDQGQCVRQSVYVLPENKHWLPGVFLSVGPIMSLFEGLVGPFPYEKLAHLESSTRFGGMENASAIFYDGKLFPKETIRDGLIAHETAHQWFGDAVTEREWSHLWLSEGFATYFAAQWTQYIRGDTAFTAEMHRIRTQVMSDKVVAVRPVIDTEQTNYLALLNANSYQKGGYVLFMLHREIGDSAFFSALKSYYRTYRHSTALTDDLRAEFEKTAGRSLKQFFAQWLTRPGVAELSIGWTRSAETGVVSLLVLQNGAHGPYELTLPVSITNELGMVTTVSVKVPALARATIDLPGHFAQSPKALAFDEDQWMLARITRL